VKEFCAEKSRNLDSNEIEHISAIVPNRETEKRAASANVVK
jgi:hypothetical protein